MSNRIYHIYCDESRHTQDRFRAYGGIIISERHSQLFDDTLSKFRITHNMRRELKWQRVSHQKELEYKAFVDHYFALNNQNISHFHCMIVDNHKTYANKNDLGFYKLYSQFIFFKFHTYYRPGVKFIIHLDQKRTNYKLDDMKCVLNNQIKKHLSITESPFVSIEPKDSKEHQRLQITDVLLGAVGYRKNKYHLISGCCRGKAALSEYILTQAGISDLDVNTPKYIKKFTIWNLKPKPRK